MGYHEKISIASLNPVIEKSVAPLPKERFALGRAQFDTLRLRLLKVAAWVNQSVRRILVRLPKAFPFAELFHHLCTPWQAPPEAT